MTKLTDAVMLEKLELATLMDEPFMVDFFRDNIPCTQLALRIITGKKDLIVKSVDVQYTMRAGEDSKYVRLDVYAVDADNKHYDIEVQNLSSGAIPQRARYNSAMIDVNILKKGDSYSLLKERESIVIFITDKDVLGEGEPIYVIDRVIMKSGKPFNDGSHIIYVNGAYKDISTELGRLVHDFHCRRSEEMMFPEFAGKTRELKGERTMGVWDEMKAEAIAEGRAEGLVEGRAEGRAEGRIDGLVEASERIAKNFIAAGKLALDEIANACGLSLQRVQELAKTTV